jgi:CBS domain-containing protein
MNTVGDLLERKGREVLSISPDALVYDAILKMAHYEIGALLVMQDGKVSGILSERDYARKIILQDRSSKSTRVSEIMTSNVFYAGPERTIEECMALMTEKRIRHLPIMDKDSVVGMVSIGDLVKEIITDQKSTIEMLEKFITA